MGSTVTPTTMTKRPIPIGELSAAAKTGRSSLYIWMLENHDTFAEVVAEAVRPNWAELAKAFGGHGLYDADEKPASAEVTRQTWWRVRKVVEARRKAAAKRQGQGQPQPQAARSLSPADPPAPPADPGNPASPTFAPVRFTDADNLDPKPKRRFAPSGPKTYPPSKDE